MKEFILNFHRYNSEGFYKPSDFHHSAVWLKLHANSYIEYLSKKNFWRPVMTWAQSHIRMTAYQILLVAAGFFLVLFSFCFVFIRLLGFVSCAYKWSCKRPINAHLWKDKEKLSSLFFCLPKMDEEEIDFKVEAEAVIEDIGFTVKSISVSRKFPSSRECVYLNVLTKECKSLCIELSVLGFRVSYVFFFSRP